MAIIDGIKVVAVKATPERLVSTSTPARWLKLYAHEDNGGPCFAGASTVIPALDGTERGMRVPKLGNAMTRGPLFMPGPLDLNKVWIAIGSLGGGDSVTFTYDDNAQPILAGT